MVGAVLVKHGRIIGRGWHRRAGEPHAEIEALQDAARQGHEVKDSTLYVTLEPCCTQGRTPPCTQSIIEAGIRRVVVAGADPNPAHAGRGFVILRRAGLQVAVGTLLNEARRLNEAFNHWIVNRTPYVTVKAAMTLDGKIATVGGESKWITGEKARAWGMKLRQASDAILVGVNTVRADDPALTVRPAGPARAGLAAKPLRRMVLDARARTPIQARMLSGKEANLTTIVVSRQALRKRVQALRKKARVLVAPALRGAAGTNRLHIDLRWLLRKLGSEGVTSLLVEGGGEVNASFLLGGLAHQVAFFYAPKIIGGRQAPKGVGGEGISHLQQAICLEEVRWRQLGPDLLMTARLAPRRARVG